MSKVGVFFLLVTVASAIELTPSNWDAETSGKSVFVKFLAPWWGHCKSMKPAWDKLMGEMPDKVYDVDCTAAGKPLCDSNGVQGFPTIKYGEVGNLEKYEGGRDYDSLAKFAKENLGPSCGPATMNLCDDEQKKAISDAMGLSDTDLTSKIEEGEKKMKDAEETFKTEVEKLQKRYEEMTKEKDEAIATVKKGGLGMMKAVKAHKRL